VKAGVVGLGLVGGSLARDLVAAGHEVVGWDANAATRRGARRAGVRVAARANAWRAFGDCEVVVFALPVTAVADALRAAAPLLTRVALVTDVGSTKRSIVAAAERCGLGSRFVGAHPMAGGTGSGWAAGVAGLFDGAEVYLCPARGATERVRRRAAAFWRSVGGRPVVVDAARHDRLVAASSHLPQFASSAVARVLSQRGVPRARLGPGGRDVTRLAAGDTGMWTAIGTDNAGEVVRALDALGAELAALRAALTGGRRGALGRWLGGARRWSRQR
jgi:cyclohexadieny/prephenate dehydrogenase